MQLSIDPSTYAQVQPVLLGYARKAVRSEDLAADLVQDTWAAGTRHLASYDGRASIRSWLVGILRHKILDHFRRSGREVPLDHVPEPVAERNGEMQPDRSRAMALIRDVLHELPQAQRRAVELCDVQGLSRERAAAELGVERGHLRVLLHRGRQRLREALQAAQL